MENWILKLQVLQVQSVKVHNLNVTKVNLRSDIVQVHQSKVDLRPSSSIQIIDFFIVWIPVVVEIGSLSSVNNLGINHHLIMASMLLILMVVGYLGGLILTLSWNLLLIQSALRSLLLLWLDLNVCILRLWLILGVYLDVCLLLRLVNNRGLNSRRCIFRSWICDTDGVSDIWKESHSFNLKIEV